MKQQIKSALAVSSAVVAVVGLALVPTVNVDAITVNPTVRAIVGATITMTTTSQGTSSNVDLGLTPGASPVLTSASDVITVNTNDTLGYLLTLADADATETLTSGGNSIAASANTSAAPAALATNTWGFALPGGPFDATYTVESNATASATKWAKIPSTGTPFTLKSTAITATNDTTTVWYAAKIDSTKPTGTYTDQVVYTATAK
ncbi:hypothetical protein H7Y29_01075 [Microbacteriaceae bacterium]|nr:hypothetical protein [Candidatus Saccharibacteria bacterium]